MKRIQERVEQLARQSPKDYSATLAALTKAVEGLQARSQPAAPTTIVDLSPIMAQLTELKQQIRQRPEYKMSQYVQYGAYAFGLMVGLLVATTWLALDWRSDRNKYAQAYTQDNWRVRYTKQANPTYYSFMEGKFKDPELTKWIVEQEEADQKRELARKATEQAKALSQQANELEGKPVEKRIEKP
ncbi:hypothetical protein [Spirosoma soli]|uniref:hypothetical protein n=1 Tax=Spirosoma soli TaxID=1770529 RepID=UPI0036D2A96B